MESLPCCSFRFSDPCLLNPSDNDSKLSGLNTPECRNGNGNGNNSNSASAASALNVNGNGSGTGTGGGDMEQQNKFFAALMEQINILHETNSKICRNLHETKGMYVGGGKSRVIPCKLKAIVFTLELHLICRYVKENLLTLLKSFLKIYRMLVFLSGIIALVVVIAVFLLCIFFYVFS